MADTLLTNDEIEELMKHGSVEVTIGSKKVMVIDIDPRYSPRGRPLTMSRLEARDRTSTVRGRLCVFRKLGDADGANVTREHVNLPRLGRVGPSIHSILDVAIKARKAWGLYSGYDPRGAGELREAMDSLEWALDDAGLIDNPDGVFAAIQDGDR